MHRGDGVTSTSSQYTQCIVNRYVRKNEVNDSYKAIAASAIATSAIKLHLL